MAKQDFWTWAIIFLMFLYFGSWIKPIFDRGFQTGDINILIGGIILLFFFYKIVVED